MEIKNVGYKPRLIYLKDKKPVSIGPRATIKVTEKDLEASPQLQELLTRGDLRKVRAIAGEKAAGDKSKRSQAEEKGKDSKTTKKV